VGSFQMVLASRARRDESTTSLGTVETNRLRRAVLDHVLAQHPHRHLTIPALVHEMQAGVFDYEEGAELETAIRDCVGEGFLTVRRSQIWPTQLALEDDEATVQERL
jgi:hypothetical protein